MTLSSHSLGTTDIPKVFPGSPSPASDISEKILIGQQSNSSSGNSDRSESGNSSPPGELEEQMVDVLVSEPRRRSVDDLMECVDVTMKCDHVCAKCDDRSAKCDDSQIVPGVLTTDKPKHKKKRQKKPMIASEAATPGELAQVEAAADGRDPSERRSTDIDDGSRKVQVSSHSSQRQGGRKVRGGVQRSESHKSEDVKEYKGRLPVEQLVEFIDKGRLVKVNHFWDDQVIETKVDKKNKKTERSGATSYLSHKKYESDSGFVDWAPGGTEGDGKEEASSKSPSSVMTDSSEGEKFHVEALDSPDGGIDLELHGEEMLMPDSPAVDQSGTPSSLSRNGVEVICEVKDLNDVGRCDQAQKNLSPRLCGVNGEKENISYSVPDLKNFLGCDEVFESFRFENELNGFRDGDDCIEDDFVMVRQRRRKNKEEEVDPRVISQETKDQCVINHRVGVDQRGGGAYRSSQGINHGSPMSNSQGNHNVSGHRISRQLRYRQGSAGESSTRTSVRRAVVGQRFSHKQEVNLAVLSDRVERNSELSIIDVHSPAVLQSFPCLTSENRSGEHAQHHWSKTRSGPVVRCRSSEDKPGDFSSGRSSDFTSQRAISTECEVPLRRESFPCHDETFVVTRNTLSRPPEVSIAIQCDMDQEEEQASSLSRREAIQHERVGVEEQTSGHMTTSSLRQNHSDTNQVGNLNCNGVTGLQCGKHCNITNDSDESCLTDNTERCENVVTNKNSSTSAQSHSVMRCEHYVKETSEEKCITCCFSLRYAQTFLFSVYEEVVKELEQEKCSILVYGSRTC